MFKRCFLVVGLLALAGPVAASEPVAEGPLKEKLLGWVKEHHNHPMREQKILGDFEKLYVENVRPGGGFSVIVGSGIFKSRKATLLAGYQNQLFALELDDEAGRKAGVAPVRMEFRALQPPAPTRLGRRALTLSGLTLNDGSQLLPAGERLAGRVSYEKTGAPPRGPLVLRLFYLTGTQMRTRTQKVTLDPKAKSGTWGFSFDPVRKEDREFRGPLALFFDVCEEGTRPNEGAIVSRGAAAAVVVVP